MNKISILSKIISLVANRTAILCFGGAVFLSGGLLSACVPLQPPVTGLSAPLTLRELGMVSAESPVAWDTSGQRLAVNDGGLTVIDLVHSERRRLNDDPFVTALTWSPDSRSIAFASGRSLRIADLDGQLLGEIPIKGACRKIYWPEQSRIIAGYSKLTTYSFGTNFQAGYVDWKDIKENTDITLVDTTIIPAHLENIDQDVPLFTFALSPWGDEIIYSKLNTPPLFSPYFQIIHRYLNGGKRIIADQLPVVSGLAFVKQGAAVLYGDGRGLVLQKDLWTDDLITKYQSAGRSLSISAGEQWSVIDNILYQDEIQKNLLASGVKAYFSPQGGRVALVMGTRLFLLEGVTENLPDSLPAEVEKKIRTLRNWRGQGLITPDEYQQQVLRLEMK